MNKKVDAFKYWVETNTEKDVSTIPKYLCQDVLDYVDTLEKALDKACEVLEDFSNTYDCYHPKQKEPFWKEQWKEYLLKEVQEDE